MPYFLVQGWLLRNLFLLQLFFFGQEKEMKFIVTNFARARHKTLRHRFMHMTYLYCIFLGEQFILSLKRNGANEF